MIAGPAEGFVGNPGPALVRQSPAPAGVGSPGNVAHHRWLVDIAIVRGVEPRAVIGKGLIEITVIPGRRAVIEILLREGIDRLAPGEFALLLFQIAFEPGELLLAGGEILAVSGNPFLPLLQLALPPRKRLGGRRILRIPVLLHGDPLLLNEGPLPFDGIPLRREPLIRKLQLKLALSLGRLLRLFLKFAELFLKPGVRFIAGNESERCAGRKCGEVRGFHNSHGWVRVGFDRVSGEIIQKFPRLKFRPVRMPPQG